jgi:trimethylamine monooxygenase
MYRNLWTIGAKEFYEFPDYTYEKHFGCVTTSFAPRLAIRNYLEGNITLFSILHQAVQ